MDSNIQPIAAIVEMFKVETQDEESRIGESEGNIGLLGPEYKDKTRRDALKFLGTDL